MRGRLTIGQAMLACLCVVIVTNKIFSPQYIIWVLPFVAAVEGFSLLWVVIGVLTTLDFPIVYGLRAPIWDAPFSWQFMPVIAARNLLMLYATLRAMLRSRHGKTSGASRQGAAPGEPSHEVDSESAPPLADAGATEGKIEGLGQGVRGS
jgi:hypothetical protein